MGIKEGLDQIQKYNRDVAEAARRAEELREAGVIPWLKIADGESVKVWYLQELDRGAKNYLEGNGLGFFATEHSSPTDFKKRGTCRMDDEERCWGCEKHKSTPWVKNAPTWKAKSKLYINVLVERKALKDSDDHKKGEVYQEVAVLSQPNGPKAVIAPMVLDYAVENNTLTDRFWKISRKGSIASDTVYTPMVYSPSDDVKPEDYADQLCDLHRCVREIPYEDQEAFFSGTPKEPVQELASVGAGESGQDTEW